MSANPFARLKKLLGAGPLQVGTVISITDGIAIVRLPTGAQVQVRGSATVSTPVFFRDGVIEGPAPAMTPIDITV